uniref:Putative tyrosine kinase eph ephrin receptor family n=1 Tax=Anopheles triannulatus TaxID=58253 RepID=A0A2M4AKF5_9DIPT
MDKYLSLLLLLCYALYQRLDVVHGDQVVLLDTTKEATLEWTRYPYGPQAQTPGWVEESFTNFVKGINWRSYVVCDVAYNNVNNWLWSPFIDRGPANRLYIEIHFTIRDCSLFPGNALSCKETFSLLFYEFDAATREPPPWQPESYKLIGRIAAGEGRFNQNSDVDINVEVKSIAVTKKGVYFAFRDQGACISVLAVKVYYITCPAVTINFAHFNETPTGREVTIIEQQMGVCVENAEAFEQPTYLCKGDGKWTILSGGCRCKVGYEPDNEKQTCNVCPVGKFRSAEVKACTICPLNSKSIKIGSPYCPCLNGHYRHPRDGKHMPCYKPPGMPTNLTLLFIDQTSAILSWNAPQRAPDEQLDPVFRSDIVFRVKCAACTSNVVFNPSSETFNDTKLTLTNLEPVTTYTVQIHSQHGLSYPIVNPEAPGSGGGTFENVSTVGYGGHYGYHATEPTPVLNVRAASDLDEIKTEFAEITFTTESAILSTVFNVKVIQITNKDANLVWDKPMHSDSPIEYYEVRWFPKSEVDAMNKSVLSTKESKVHISDLLENTEYGFQVRCKTLNGWGTFSNIVYAQTHQSVSPVYDDSFQMRIVAGTTVMVVVILVLIIVVTVVFLKSKNHDDIDKKTNNHLPLPLDYASNEGMFDTDPCSSQHALRLCDIVSTPKPYPHMPPCSLSVGSELSPNNIMCCIAGYNTDSQLFRRFLACRIRT